MCFIANARNEVFALIQFHVYSSIIFELHAGMRIVQKFNKVHLKNTNNDMLNWVETRCRQDASVKDG